jgi:hypothetical protein
MARLLLLALKNAAGALQVDLRDVTFAFVRTPAGNPGFRPERDRGAREACLAAAVASRNLYQPIIGIQQITHRALLEPEPVQSPLPRQTFGAHDSAVR